VVSERSELVRRYREWMAHDTYLSGLEQDFGDVYAPMLQRFGRSAAAGVYSLSGFVDQRGELLGARATRKVLQRPKRVGVGLCFEDAPVIPQVLDGLVRLCRRVGYFGVFEAEFIVEGDRHQLTISTPLLRQMHFDSARIRPPS
jgi:hypothetical protein